jgi:4-carboxymuconolactone decarboxylase
MPGNEPMLISDDVLSVAPALRAYMQGDVLDGLWKRPQLSLRDRSIVTLSVLITRNQTLDLPFYLRLALDNGLKPAEISEIVTHLAFYAGLGNAGSTIAIVKGVFAERGVGADELPPTQPTLLPLDEAAEATRAANVEKNTGPISPGLVLFTADVLFLKLWLRPDLAPRDRSLVTVSSLMAAGHVAQITFHLNKAMDNGLTKEQAGEVIAQVAFYAGWPNAFSAAPVVGAVFKSRGE